MNKDLSDSLAFDLSMHYTAQDAVSLIEFDNADDYSHSHSQGIGHSNFCKEEVLWKMNMGLPFEPTSNTLGNLIDTSFLRDKNGKVEKFRPVVRRSIRREMKDLFFHIILSPEKHADANTCWTVAGYPWSKQFIQIVLLPECVHFHTILNPHAP